ncbi:hypothetical protein BKA62DRAFT_46244 [Auriculariales sp. MPI-PUGE-AT-0066]|nr:hypothetical protein BKA62DRAFT_46244 [Auriculariales sp. MPI-PUGE-AT-0066]
MSTRNISSTSCLWYGCNAVCDTPKELAEHLRAVHVSVLNVDSVDRRFNCRWIGCPSRPSWTRDRVYRHMLGHTSYRPFVCQDCGKGYRSQEHLNRHSESRCGLGDAHSTHTVLPERVRSFVLEPVRADDMFEALSSGRRPADPLPDSPFLDPSMALLPVHTNTVQPSDYAASCTTETFVDSRWSCALSGLPENVLGFEVNGKDDLASTVVDDMEFAELEETMKSLKKRQSVLDIAAEIDDELEELHPLWEPDAHEDDAVCCASTFTYQR